MKKLLQKFLEALPDIWEYTDTCGLCVYIFDIKLSFKPTQLLQDYLEENLPEMENYPSGKFCWPPGELEPRIDWLKEQIEKL